MRKSTCRGLLVLLLMWKGSVVSLRASLYSVVTFCLSAYEVPECYFASGLLDVFCSSLFIVVEGDALS
jgi:hypothetical protein